MIPCYSEFPAYALSLNLSDECVSTKLRVTGNHACFILVILNCIYIYIYITDWEKLRRKLTALM